MGSKMKSNADIIYNHIEKQKGDFVVHIEVIMIEIYNIY